MPDAEEKRARAPTSSSPPAATYRPPERRFAHHRLSRRGGRFIVRAMREIVFDTETTGLSPLTGDRMVEIGCVELFNRVETGRTFHAYFNPVPPMPSGAEAVHGLSDIFLSDKPAVHATLRGAARLHRRCPLSRTMRASISASSTTSWRCAAAARLHEPDDRHAGARAQRHPGAKHSLDALCTRFGVDRSLRVKHGALIDAQLLAQCYVELTGGRQIGLSLAASTRDRRLRPAASTGAAAPLRSIVVRPPRPHAPSEDELERHAAFVATLVDPIWIEAGRSPLTKSGPKPNPAPEFVSGERDGHPGLWSPGRYRRGAARAAWRIG
jgi:DNA polymerase-3 subunit epsilon